MSINGDVLIKLAAGLPKDLARELAKRNGLGGLGAVAGGAARSALDDAINRAQPQEIDIPEVPYDIPDVNLPKGGLPPSLDVPEYWEVGPVNIPKRSGDIGRAAGRAARTVRDGAVNTARGVGRSVTDAVRGFGEGWRGR